MTGGCGKCGPLPPRDALLCEVCVRAARAARAITRPEALKALLEIAAENELVFEYDKGVFTVRRVT